MVFWLLIALAAPGPRVEKEETDQEYGGYHQIPPNVAKGNIGSLDGVNLPGKG